MVSTAGQNVPAWEGPVSAEGAKGCFTVRNAPSVNGWSRYALCTVPTALIRDEACMRRVTIALRKDENFVNAAAGRMAVHGASPCAAGAL